jgi:hypothetical protein
MTYRRLRAIALTAALALSSTLLAQPAAARIRQQTAPTTIPNGSFEDPVLDPGTIDLPGDNVGTPLGGWLMSTGSAGITRRALTSSSGASVAPPDGAQAAYLEGTGNFGRIINWTAGSYRVSFRAMAEPGSTVSFGVVIGGQRLITITALTGDGYESFTTAEFTVTNRTLPLVWFPIPGNTARVQIDDVRVTPTVANVAAVIINDRNANARIDFSDRPLSNWTVTLTSNDSGVVRTATSSGLGLAFFNGIPTGSYTLCETLQAGFRATRPTTLNASGQPCYTFVARENTQSVAIFLNTTRPAPTTASIDSSAAVDDGAGISSEPISPDGPTLPQLSRGQVFLPLAGNDAR